jgi:hypothetical protein
MKNMLLIFLFLIFIANICAYTTAQYTTTFIDPTRNNRQIQTVIYYPAEIASISENCPYIIFGHGWLMNHTFYTTLTDALIDLGWIVCFPRTEEGLFPSHSEFALDLSFLRNAVLTENVNSNSSLYGHMSDLAVEMGHSMGGGAAVLAAGMDNGFASLITFAAAETTPSAINGATNVMIPSITFAGSSDNIAPPAQNQLPIYNNLSSIFKSYISITGSGHLDLYNNALISPILTPWFEYLRTSDLEFLDLFEEFLFQNTSVLTYQIQDNIVSNNDNVSSPIIGKLELYPNPLKSLSMNLNIKFTPIQGNQVSTFEIYNIRGQKVKSLSITEEQSKSGSVLLFLKDFPSGVYLCVLTSGEQRLQRKIAVIK